MIELRGYIDESGNKRFAGWLGELDAAAAKVTIALARMEQGNFSKVRGVGSGIVILIGGGTKKRQKRDMAAAQECWAVYKRRKKEEIQ